MLKKTIKYTDYNGKDREETYYFNLSKSEVTEMELSVSGGISKKLNEIITNNDMPEMIKFFKELILKSVGIKSEDGQYIEKSEEFSNRFYHSEAYSNLFIELLSDEKNIKSFVNNVLPKNVIPNEIENTNAITENTVSVDN